MTLTQRSLERISTSVAYTESVQRGTKTGRRKGWPRINQNQWIVKGTVVNNAITWGGTGEINVNVNGVPQNEPYKTVSHDWLGEQASDISVGIKLVAFYFQDEDIWSIIAADCEPEAAPAPPGHGDNIDLTGFGTTTGTAKGIGFRVNRVTVVNAGVDDAVRLSGTSEQGDDIFIVNAHATDTMQIFPNTGGEIDNGGTDIPVTLPAGGSAHFFLVQADEWVT